MNVLSLLQDDPYAIEVHFHGGRCLFHATVLIWAADGYNHIVTGPWHHKWDPSNRIIEGEIVLL
jgi:hypothetical protein